MEDTQDLSACVTKLQENVLRWEQRLQLGSVEPTMFRQAVEELRSALNDIGRVGFHGLVQACESASETMESDGQVYRFKQVVDKEWMTLWGKVILPRRLYQADRGGPSRVPLDERYGMAGRFMVPELERVTAFLGARLVPAEVEDSLREMLPAPKRGRPAERPMATDTQHTPTAWKEAGVGMVASYMTPLDPEFEEPERIDVRYAAVCRRRR